MDYHNTLRANIRAELGRRGLSQQEAADAIGIRQSSMSARIQGKVEFKVSELIDLARCLEVPFSRLVEGLDEALSSDSPILATAVGV